MTRWDETYLVHGWVPAENQPDPAARAALQEQYRNEQLKVPESYLLQEPSNPLAEAPPGMVQGNLPKPGWTCQNSSGSPFGPYAPTRQTPDWGTEPGSLGAGRYDQNQSYPADDPHSLNQMPIGGAVLDAPQMPPNPNFFPEDVGGTGWHDLEI